MLLEIDPSSGVPIYLQIIRQIREQIITGEMKEGESLDSVRELAARLKVNPMTVSKAYSFLEAEGLAERRRGIGLFAANVKKGKRDQIKAHLLNQILEKGAILAIQMDISEEEAIEVFQKHYREYQRKNRRQP